MVRLLVSHTLVAGPVSGSTTVRMTVVSVVTVASSSSSTKLQHGEGQEEEFSCICLLATSSSKQAGRRTQHQGAASGEAPPCCTPKPHKRHSAACSLGRWQRSRCLHCDAVLLVGVRHHGGLGVWGEGQQGPVCKVFIHAIVAAHIIPVLAIPRPHNNLEGRSGTAARAAAQAQG